jgi:hypothetical protein
MKTGFNKNAFKKPVASVFFRFSHRDKDNNILTNKEQKKVVEDIYAKLLDNIHRVA